MTLDKMKNRFMSRRYGRIGFVQRKLLHQLMLDVSQRIEEKYNPIGNVFLGSVSLRASKYPVILGFATLDFMLKTHIFNPTISLLEQ